MYNKVGMQFSDTSLVQFLPRIQWAASPVTAYLDYVIVIMICFSEYQANTFDYLLRTYLVIELIRKLIDNVKDIHYSHNNFFDVLKERMYVLKRPEQQYNI